MTLRFLPAVFCLLPFVATAQQFTPWSAPVNLGPVVNSPYADSCTSISKNGLSLFFFSNRYALNASAPWHLYVANRPSVDAPWGTPQEIATFNDGYPASCPALSPDEHRMYFASNRPGTCGGSDIWVARRHDRRDDLGWKSPVNLGCQVNSPQGESAPTVIEDENGSEILFFSSSRLGMADVFESRMRPDDTFGPAVLIAELSSATPDYAAIRRDGLEAVVSTLRPGGTYPGTMDLWGATRSSTSAPWSPLVPLAVLNSVATDSGRMSFSFDGLELYFTSDRLGTYGSRDLYVARREKLRQ